MSGTDARHETTGGLRLEVVDEDGRVLEAVYVSEISERSSLRGRRPSSQPTRRHQDD